MMFTFVYHGGVRLCFNGSCEQAWWSEHMRAQSKLSVGMRTRGALSRLIGQINSYFEINVDAK